MIDEEIGDGEDFHLTSKSIFTHSLACFSFSSSFVVVGMLSVV